MSASLPSGRAATPAHDTFTTWLELRTRNRDTDQFGHVNHAAMASLFEESRIALVFTPELEGETSGIDLMVANLTMAFHKELNAPGVVQVGAMVAQIGSSSLEIRQGIFVDQTCFASAVAVCVLIGSDTRRPVPASQALRADLLKAP